MISAIAPNPVLPVPQVELDRLWNRADEPQIEAIMAALTAGLNGKERTASGGIQPYGYGLDTFSASRELLEERRAVISELGPNTFSEGWHFSSFDHMLNWAVAMHQDLEEAPADSAPPVHAHGYYDENGDLIQVKALRIQAQAEPQPESVPVYQVEVQWHDGCTLVSAQISGLGLEAPALSLYDPSR